MTQAPNVSSESADSFAAILRNALRGSPDDLNAHLIALNSPTIIDSTKTTLHTYHLPVDGNGRLRFKPLAEYLRDRIIDYAIPRKTFDDALAKVTETGSAASIVRLQQRARALFTDLANSGEGGELLLFAMAESVLKFVQIICKMSLKTSSSMHFHGADGVYAEARPDGGLDIYWGESKIYGDCTAGVRDCITSLAPFLVAPDGDDASTERDILLINEFANFSDQRIVNGLKEFLNRDNAKSLLVRHCGLALVIFDCESYPADSPEMTAEEIKKALIKGEASWTKPVRKRISKEKLSSFNIHFICVPMRSATDFRDYFLEVLGKI